MQLKQLFANFEQIQSVFGYTQEELLIFERSYKTIFEDPTTGGNQKASAFWTIIIFCPTKMYTMQTKEESDPDWKNLPDDQLKGYLKIQGYARL